MNIVILQGAYFPIPPMMGGAVEKMWFRLGQEFAMLGHHVTQISKQYPGFPKCENIQGVVHHRVRGYDAPRSILKNNILDAIYSWRAIKKIPVMTDVVITNTFWSPVFLRSNNSAVVYVDVARMPKGQLRLYSRADCLRANSSAVVAAIKNELPSVDHYRIGLVPNPLPFKVAEEIDLADKKPVILYCGRVHSEKGLELLAKSVNGIDLHGWKIQIVGPWKVSMGGSGEAFKERLTKCFGTADVEFTGPIFDEARLNALYRDASIFVYPSVAEKGETFGLAPLEAMAWGAVPIVSDLLCFKDFIRDEINGLVFNHRASDAVERLSNTILRLVGNRIARESLASNSLRVRDTHSTSSIAWKFVSEFDRLLDARRGMTGAIT